MTALRLGIDRSDLKKQQHIITFCGNAKCSLDDPVMFFVWKTMYETVTLTLLLSVLIMTVELSVEHLIQSLN